MNTPIRYLDLLSVATSLAATFSSTTEAISAEVVFNPSDFLQVGTVDASPTVREIESARTQAGDLTPSVAGYLYDGAIGIIGLKYEKVQAVYDLYKNSQSTIGAMSASEINQIAKSFSSVDAEAAFDAVSNAKELASNTRSALNSGNVQAPPLQLYFAAAVSEKARGDISSGLSQYQSLSVNLTDTRADIISMSEKMNLLANRANLASEAALTLAESLAQIPFASASAADLIAAYSDLQELSRQASDAAGRLEGLLSKLDATSMQVNKNIDSYKFALTFPLAQSKYTMSADIVGGDSAYFDIGFQGNTFFRNGADSPGS